YENSDEAANTTDDGQTDSNGWAHIHCNTKVNHCKCDNYGQRNASLGDNVNKRHWTCSLSFLARIVRAIGLSVAVITVPISAVIRQRIHYRVARAQGNPNPYSKNLLLYSLSSTNKHISKFPRQQIFYHQAPRHAYKESDFIRGRVHR